MPIRDLQQNLLGAESEHTPWLKNELFRVDVRRHSTHAMARWLLFVACVLSAFSLASAARPNPHDGIALKISRHAKALGGESDLKNGEFIMNAESLATPQCDAAWKILNSDRSTGGYIETVEKIFAIGRAVGQEAGAVCGAHLKVRWDAKPVYCKQSCSDFWTPERMDIADELDAHCVDKRDVERLIAAVAAGKVLSHIKDAHKNHACRRFETITQVSAHHRAPLGPDQNREKKARVMPVNTTSDAGDGDFIFNVGGDAWEDGASAATGRGALERAASRAWG